MSDAATDTAPEDEAAPAEIDEARNELEADVRRLLGDAVVASEVNPGHDLHVRLATDAWGSSAETIRYDLGFRYFCFLSVIDWMPSPFGRYMETEPETLERHREALEDVVPIEPGACGADRRFQIIARVRNLTTGLDLSLRADTTDDEAPAIDSWVGTYAGAEWHEREAWEMFGIEFRGHPGLRHLYLPGGFEGNPLRKDFPLLSRLVKPWPGIVDVEPMPEVDEPDSGDDAGSEDASAGEASA